MKDPLISIALATYNGSRFLEEQLDSLLSQSYRNIEIIIVDDCSTDNTVAILEKYKSNNECISLYVNEKNLGYNQTFEVAIRHCKGDYIAISDQDDIWLPNKLEVSLKNIGDNILVYSNSELMNEYGVDLNRRNSKQKKLYSGNESRIFSVFNRVSGHTILFKSEIVPYILPIPKHCHYDWWLGFVATNLGSILCLDNFYVMHRKHQNNETPKMRIKNNEDGYVNLKNWCETILRFPKLKNRSFFEKLHTIISMQNSRKKDRKLILFQIRYCNVMFDGNFFSKLNRARKLRLPHIPR